MAASFPEEPRLKDLQAKVAEFRDQRDWQQFHTLKDLAAALAIEASELQQEFLWLREDAEDGRLVERRAHIEAELADVLILALSFADAAEIDLPTAVLSKLEENAMRYPVEKARGSSRKYTDL